MTTQAVTVIAVSKADADKYGCPHCGYRSGHTPVTAGGTELRVCGECGRDFCVVGLGYTKSAIEVNGSFPAVEPHPRHSTLKHGRPDARPPAGEYFNSRGIGKDSTPGCFVCGGDYGEHYNIAGFVQCRASGARIIEMFERGALLDYRYHEPDRVQVKIGACQRHIQHLENLDAFTKQAGGIITREDVAEARS